MIRTERIPRDPPDPIGLAVIDDKPPSSINDGLTSIDRRVGGRIVIRFSCSYCRATREEYGTTCTCTDTNRQDRMSDSGFDSILVRPAASPSDCDVCWHAR